VGCAVGMPLLKRTANNMKFIHFSNVAGGKAIINLVGKNYEPSYLDEVTWGEVIGVPTLAWSPDGEKIAFTSVVGGKPVIGVVGKNGENLKPVVQGYSARWSPDGKQILIRHDSESTPSVTSIWVANADGTQPRKVLDNEAADFGLTWFPDGKSIAFGSERENKKQSEIFRINIDGTGLEKIATEKGLMLSSPVFSPDGTKLVVDAAAPWFFMDITDDFSIWIVDLVAHQQERLVKGNHASVLWEMK
jgi:Tol biopolymer transport system component